MKNIKTVLFSTLGILLLSSNAFATQSSQILQMSNQLYVIAKDLTSGLLPTSILLIAIGLWGAVHAFGKNVGDGIHQLTNIIAVGGVVFFATAILTNAAIFSALM